ILRPMGRQVETVEDEKALLLDAARERGLERVLLLTGRQVLLVRAWGRPMARPAVAVNRRAGAALAGASRALLLERLAAAPGDFGAGLGLVGPPALAGPVRLDRLPHEVAAERVLEHGGGQLDLPHSLLLPVHDGQFRHVRHSDFPK